MPAVLEKIEKRADVIESFNPANGRKLGEVSVSTPDDVVAAVARAREAQKGWQALGAAGRAEILLRLKQVMLDRADEIAEVVHSENGKPRVDAITEIATVSEGINFFAKLAKKLDRGVKVSPTNLFMGAKARIFYEPLGVAGFIMPWNFPFELGMKHMLPALAAGNACIQKPSEFNPLIGDLIGRLFLEAGVPKGVVQIIHGMADVGQALIDNVDVICFVGSPGTGRRIMARAADRLIPVVLELGGNDAAIVRKDANLDWAARGLVFGACLNAGQICDSVERVYAHKDIIEALTQKIVEQTKKLRHNTGEGTYELGPVKWAPQRKIYESQMADAVQKGARVVTGGRAIERDGGVFWPPTVLTNVDHTMEVMKEETFGPFIPIMAVENDEQAIQLANDTEYGLGGSVWTEDSAAGEAIARRMKAGSVVINNAVIQAACITLPFGGERKSGVGRSWSEGGFYNYVAPKGVMRFGTRMPQLGWLPYTDTSESQMLGLAKFLYSNSIGKRLAGLGQVIRAFRGKK